MNFATYTRWKDNRFHGVADTPTIAPPSMTINPGLDPHTAHRLEKATAGCARGSARWCAIKANLTPPAPTPKTCVDNCTGETYSTIGDCGVKTCTPPAATPPPAVGPPSVPPPTQPVPGGGDFLCTILGICAKQAPTDQPVGPTTPPGASPPSDSTGQLLDTFMKLFGGQVAPASPAPSSEGSVVTVPAAPAPAPGGSGRPLVIIALVIALGLGGFWLYKKLRKKG